MGDGEIFVIINFAWKWFIMKTYEDFAIFDNNLKIL